MIEAEAGAISYYNEIREYAGEVDPVTEDMMIAILRDEQGHMREFEGFLREYEAEGLGLIAAAGDGYPDRCHGNAFRLQISG